MRLSRLCACILMLATASSLPAVTPSVSAAAQTRSTARSGFSLQSQRFRSDGWRWQLTAAKGGDRILGFTMVARRTPQGESTPLEVHTWRFRLATRDLTVDHADLMPTRLNTGTDLGRFGAIDVSLEDGTTLESKSITCRATGEVTTRIHSRTGTFSGSFDFKPGKGFPSDVAPTSFSGTIRKLYSTDRSCPSGTGGGCLVDTSIAAFRAGDDRRGTLFADDRPDGSSIYLDDGRYAAHKTVSIAYAMLAAVPAGAVVVSGGTAVVHSKPFGSWADGTITLALGEAHVHRLSPTCVRTFYDVASQSGGITVHFATGDVHYATPFPHGIGVTIVKHG